MKYVILKSKKEKIQKGDEFQNPTNKRWYKAMKSEFGEQLRPWWVVRRPVEAPKKPKMNSFYDLFVTKPKKGKK